MAEVFNAYGHYYDLLYYDKDYAAETDYISRLLKTYGAGKDVLEFGSGTGKHGRLLAERGYQVTGVERSAEMIACAQQTESFACIEGDICTIRLDRSFDAVLALFQGQLSDEQCGAVRHLRSCGRAPAERRRFRVRRVYSPAVYAQRCAGKATVRRGGGDHPHRGTAGAS